MNRKEQIEKATPSYIKYKYSHLDHSFIDVDNDNNDDRIFLHQNNLHLDLEFLLGVVHSLF